VKDRSKNDKMTKYKYACQSILQKRGSRYSPFFYLAQFRLFIFNTFVLICIKFVNVQNYYYGYWKSLSAIF